MRIIVQKFGGTSVATENGRRRIVEKVQRAQAQGYLPLIVVSAMGRRGAPYATDTLIDMVKSENPHVALRELDHLMCCGEIISAVVITALLQSENIEAVALTGGQAGIITDEEYGNAHILQIETKNLLKLLEQKKVPVVCGFQGMSSYGNLTTLGRGGSDTTAAALGAAVNAEIVEIYTDVDGIMTADPRIVDDARILDQISYGEICQLAHQGAKVIHPRAVEIAMQKNIPLVIKSTFSDAKGTLISNFDADTHVMDNINDKVATGVTYLREICQVKIDNVDYKLSGAVFKLLAASGISVDLINVHPDCLIFTINENYLPLAKEKLNDLGLNLTFRTGCAKVSVVGGGMRGVPGVMADFVDALSACNIEILQSADSHTSISVLIKQEHLETAVRALHKKFQL